MLIESLSYRNRWRRVSPVAKSSFAVLALLAVFNASSLSGACAVILSVVLLTCLGAGIGGMVYLRVLLPGLFFLAMGGLPLFISLDMSSSGFLFLFSQNPQQIELASQVMLRGLGGLVSLLFLAMTTPLSDLLHMLRRMKVPAVLLDLMVLCYRGLAIFSSVSYEILNAQSARLGYSTPRLAFHSLGGMLASLLSRIGQHAYGMQQAAQARNGGGELRFIGIKFQDVGRDMGIAVTGGATLLLLVFVL